MIVTFHVNASIEYVLSFFPIVIHHGCHDSRAPPKLWRGVFDLLEELLNPLSFIT